MNGLKSIPRFVPLSPRRSSKWQDEMGHPQISRFRRQHGYRHHRSSSKVTESNHFAMNPRHWIRGLPLGVRERLFYRFLNSRQASYPDLFDDAPLRFAGPYRMRRLVCGDVISGQIAVNGFYELGLSRELRNLAREGGQCLDVGANLGYFTLLWLAGNSANSVVAVEASPRNQEAIRDNLAYNGLTDRAKLLACAAGDAPRTVPSISARKTRPDGAE